MSLDGAIVVLLEAGADHDLVEQVGNAISERGFDVVPSSGRSRACLVVHGGVEGRELGGLQNTRGVERVVPVTDGHPLVA